MQSLPMCDCWIPKLSSLVSCCDVWILTGDSSKVGVDLGCSLCQCMTVAYLNSLH